MAGKRSVNVCNLQSETDWGLQTTGEPGRHYEADGTDRKTHERGMSKGGCILINYLLLLF
jgi:hypothetical protein